MSVALQERPTAFFATAELDRMLPHALYSEDELRAMPVEDRGAHFEIGKFVRRALSDNLEEPIRPEEGWQVAATFLKELHAASEEKAVWGAENMRDEVVEGLCFSLRWNKATKSNAHIYMDAMKAMFLEGKLRKSFDINISESLVRNHKKLWNLADDDTRNEYREFIKRPDVICQLSNAYYVTGGQRDNKLINKGGQLYKDLLGSIGFENPDECVSEWMFRSEEHIKRIGILEAERPGAAALLANFYGIRRFARYSKDKLIAQAEAHGDTSKPYGIQITATADLERAYATDTRSEEAALAGLVRRGNYFVRAMEAATTEELYRRMSALDRMYGDEHKISFAVVTAHGTPGTLEFGLGYERYLGKLTMDHSLGMVRQWFIDNPTIILDSCSTGAEHGMAQKVSRKLHATTTGPETPSGLESLAIIEDGESIQLIPVHRHGNSMKREKVVYARVALYIDGERIESDDPRYISYFAKAEPRSYKDA